MVSLYGDGLLKSRSGRKIFVRTIIKEWGKLSVLGS